MVLNARAAARSYVVAGITSASSVLRAIIYVETTVSFPVALRRAMRGTVDY